MLKHLTVENYALIERLDMTLDSRLNIITGETGAGKSILLGAIGLLLGGRADVAALKQAANNCVVEGVFDIAAYGLESFFEQNDLDYDGEVVIRRVVTTAGKSRAYVNDLPVSLAVLKELGARLIDIHSQHRTLMLAEEDFRMQIVDSLAENGALRADYAERYEALRRAERELSELTEEVAKAERDREYVEFQHSQLASMKLRKGELEELEAEQRLLDNVERIGAAIGESLAALDQEEEGVLARLSVMTSAFGKLAEVYAPAQEIAERLRGVAVELKDLDSTLADELSRVESNPQRAQQVVDRLDGIYTLMRKHSVQTVEELIAIEADYARRLGVLNDSSEQLAALQKRVEQCHKGAVAAAAKLTSSRKKAAVLLAEQTEQMLHRLGMEHARFVVDVVAMDSLSAMGADGVEFLFSSTPKFAPQPLERVASGGETSRVMLCLKALVVGKTNMPTVIFDEIDTGVSGRIADEMGRIISEMSQGRQVVNITHLAQVASKGDTHFTVYKDAKEGITRIALLSAEERIREVASMISGNEVTEAAIAQARTLLGV